MLPDWLRVDKLSFYWLSLTSLVELCDCLPVLPPLDRVRHRKLETSYTLGTLAGTTHRFLGTH